LKWGKNTLQKHSTAEIEEEFNPFPSTSDPFDFDALLKQAKHKMGKR
jgi:hypothetical protein